MSTETHSDTNVIIEEPAASEYAKRTVTIDFLFLDREGCERCGGAEKSLHRALDRVADVFADLDIDVLVRKVQVRNEADARRTDFEISPTIRIDGRDIQPEYIETACESCGELCGCSGGFDDENRIDCRSWLYRGEKHTIPPVEFITEELLRGAFAERDASIDHGRTDQHRVPGNLRKFFAGSGDRFEEPEDDGGPVIDPESRC